MKIVKLYGDLAKKFGRSFKLDVKTPAEAIRALCVIRPGFRKYMEDNSEPGYVVRVGRDIRGEDELTHPFSIKETFKIIPVTAGASGFFKVVLGVALIAVAWWNPLAWGAVATLATGATGVALALGGVVDLLSPAPAKQDAPTNPESTPSYMFNGPVNTSGPGYAVPIGYGELLIGSHVVSAELYSVEEPISGAGGFGTKSGLSWGGVLGAVYRKTANE